MDSAEAVSAFRLVVAVAILALASVLDVRTRKVGNRYWIAMAAIGLVLIPVQLSIDGGRWEYLVVFVPILAILSDVYWDAKPGTRLETYGPAVKYVITVLSLFLIAYYWGSIPYFQHLFAIPIMMLAIVGMYMLDIIRGGADAKALISMSILFPFYPIVGPIPAIQGSELSSIVFPFSFTVLVNAAIIVAIIMPLGFLISNLAAGDLRFPNALFGRKMDVDSAKVRHVWLMERIVNGTHVFYTRPKREEDLVKELDLLKRAGFNRVWVTPKIPFMLPMLASLAVSAIVGNFLILLFPL